MTADDGTQPFSWEDYLTLAKELSQRTDIASQRSAVSRAYYAVFHAARHIVVHVRDVQIGRHDAHTAVWRYFCNKRPGQRRIENKIGLNGQRLRALRNGADYEDNFPIAMVTDAIELAERTISALKDLPS